MCDLPAILRGEVERGFSAAVADTRVASVLQQLCHHFRVTVLRGTMQCSFVILCL